MTSKTGIATCYGLDSHEVRVSSDGDRILHSHHHENLNSYKIFLSSTLFNSSVTHSQSPSQLVMEALTLGVKQSGYQAND
jgi:hypothetical protein